MDPFIAYLLGQQPQQPQRAPAAPVAQPDNEMVVNSRRMTDPGFGVVKKGPFSAGRTGGNILGLLGDALLIGGGADPIYQPRIQQMREAEALLDLQDDPKRALAQWSQANPRAAAEYYQKQQEIDASRMGAEAVAAERAQNVYDTVNQRALAYLGAATEKSAPAIRELFYRTYREAGLQPPFDLPDDYKEWQGLGSGAISQKDRAELEEAKNYNEARIRQAQYEERGRTYRDIYGEYMDEVQNRRDNRTARANAETRASSRKGLSIGGKTFEIDSQGKLVPVANK